VTDWQLIDYW